MVAVSAVIGCAVSRISARKSDARGHEAARDAHKEATDAHAAAENARNYVKERAAKETQEHGQRHAEHAEKALQSHKAARELVEKAEKDRADRERAEEQHRIERTKDEAARTIQGMYRRKRARDKIKALIRMPRVSYKSTMS